MTTKRRRFLAGAGAAALGGLAGVVQRAHAVAPASRHGDLRDIEHIVLLTQENRAFDHYFGALPGVRGFADPFPVPLPGGRTVWQQPAKDAASRRSVAPFRIDTRERFALMRVEGTPHRWPDAQQAWDHGRMAHWPASKEDHSMAFFGPADLPFHVALADAFTLCDAYHCSFQGGTWPNRLFMWTGTNDPHGTGGGPALYNEFEDFGKPEDTTGYRWTTYAERLQAAGVSWQVYQDVADNFGDNPLAGFRVFRDAFHRRPGHDPALRERAATTRALDALRADVVARRLPAVSWVVAPVADSEHPWKSSPAQGADYTARVLDALLADEEVWSRTVLLVNYDENDGYFDHVPPPAPPSLLPGAPRPAGESGVSTEGEMHRRLAPEHPEPAENAWLQRPYGLGPRVPMFVVSPFSRGGHVCSEVFDHTSTLRLLEKRFGVACPEISAWRRAVCGDLTSAFDFKRGAAPPPRLPSIAQEAARARALPGTTRPVPPAQPVPPVQPPGARPARALPYALQASCSVGARELTLNLDNRGRTGAVIHVYDRLNLAAAPRRYTAAVGQTLQDRWPLTAEGRHDLWLLGPNGWHRHFAGRGAAAQADVQLETTPEGLVLRLDNPDRGEARFSLAAVTYADPAPRVVVLPPRSAQRLVLPLPVHRWYDWRVTRADDPAFVRRFAGHVENGEASITDPAMHGPALFTPDAPRPKAIVKA
ncbi:MAG: phospholipase C, phosphocholine-specific [Rubrivivax sp.]|nr:phospholipase C, phosphocholine-specific [Rubrivivax sp.]